MLFGRWKHILLFFAPFSRADIRGPLWHPMVLLFVWAAIPSVVVAEVFHYPESDYSQLSIDSGACTEGLATSQVDCAILSRILTGNDLPIADTPNPKGCIYFPGNLLAGLDAIVQWNTNPAATPPCDTIAHCVCDTYPIWQLPVRSCGGDADQVFSSRGEARNACEAAGCLNLADARYLDNQEVLWRQDHQDWEPVFGGEFCSTNAARREHKSNWFNSILPTVDDPDSEQINDQDGDEMNLFLPAWWMSAGHTGGTACGSDGWNVEGFGVDARAACFGCTNLRCSPPPSPPELISPPPPPDGTCDVGSYTTAPDHPSGNYLIFKESNGCPVFNGANPDITLANGVELIFCDHVSVVDGTTAVFRKLEPPRCLKECTQIEYENVPSCNSLCPSGFNCCAGLGDTCIRNGAQCPECPDCATNVDNGSGDSFWNPKNKIKFTKLVRKAAVD